MGNPWFKDDRGQMCFNPAKTFQIASAGAWYDEKYILTWDSGTGSPNFWKRNLIGVADYENNPSEAALVVKLHTNNENDYFIGFNRAYGINVDSKNANDKVSIIEAGNNGKGYSKSVMIAQLGGGQSYTFENWRGSGKTLVVKVSNIVTNSSPWFAEVELNFDNAPVPTDSPSNKPSNPATLSPSTQPTQTPVVFPSKTPSLSPTLSSTGNPTSTSPTTLSPTLKCGDLVCSIDETDINCPTDCSQIEFATFEENIGAKGSNGECGLETYCYKKQCIILKVLVTFALDKAQCSRCKLNAMLQLHPSPRSSDQMNQGLSKSTLSLGGMQTLQKMQQHGLSSTITLSYKMVKIL